MIFFLILHIFFEISLQQYWSIIVISINSLSMRVFSRLFDYPKTSCIFQRQSKYITSAETVELVAYTASVYPLKAFATYSRFILVDMSAQPIEKKCQSISCINWAWLDRLIWTISIQREIPCDAKREFCPANQSSERKLVSNFFHSSGNRFSYCYAGVLKTLWIIDFKHFSCHTSWR